MSEVEFKNWSRGIRNMYQQKPSEWSDEDKSFYDSIMCEVVKEGMSLTPAQANWLKSLPERFNLQSKQEWSKEDERLLNVIIDILDKEEHNGHMTHNELKMCVRLLKSLHLQPKSGWRQSISRA